MQRRFFKHNFKAEKEKQALSLPLFRTVQTEHKQKVNYESKVRIDSIKRINLCVLYVRYINIAHSLTFAENACMYYLRMWKYTRDFVFHSTNLIFCVGTMLHHQCVLALVQFYSKISTFVWFLPTYSSSAWNFWHIERDHHEWWECVDNPNTNVPRELCAVYGNCIRCLNVCVCVCMYVHLCVPKWCLLVPRVCGIFFTPNSIT